MSRSQRQSVGLISLILVCAVAVVAWKALYRPVPSYQGKSLTQWADQFGSNNWRGAGTVAAEEARVAIQHIGTNGIPFLIDLVRVEQASWKKKLRPRVPRSWHTRLRLNDKSQNIRRTGAHGIAALETNAAAALPDLIRIAKTHPETDGRYIAGFAIRTLGTAAEPAIPFLIQSLTNEANIIRDDAALALGSMQLQPETVVPALVAYLDATIKAKKAGWELEDAIESVSKFGPEARSAIPILRGLLDYSDGRVRSNATNALGRINPRGAWNRDAVRPR